MQCPNCNYPKTCVFNSYADDLTRKRQRKCVKCNYKFNTIEHFIREKDTPTPFRDAFIKEYGATF